RDRIAPALHRRGAIVLRADVYDRVPIAPRPRAVRALATLDTPLWLALSSGEALDRVLATLPAGAGATLRRARVLAASARLSQLAHARGFDDIRIATSARPRDLLAAALQPATATPPLA
ncbi:MAG: uroporphyrinogen-III synthase, partial [Gammaproteobacteria bacterium]|nr:uroporphyrinogen-III synthase [Gammaproteobacteria bacterium]